MVNGRWEVELGAELGAEAGSEGAAVRSFALRELSMCVPAGTLSVIIGEVGCRPHVLEAAASRT